MAARFSHEEGRTRQPGGREAAPSKTTTILLKALGRI